MAVNVPEDPTIEIQRARTRIENGTPPQADMDEKELAEREEAAKAYAGENESHFVSYMQDMVQLSVDTMTDIRKEQEECWDVFNEKEPDNFAFKETWQSRPVIPKPNIYIMSFLAVVRKAFDPQFLSIEGETEDKKEDAEFIQKLMTIMLAKSMSNFPINFTDATCMGAAVGQSMEMIPIWNPGQGLSWDLIEPWKIHRDPDSLSRHSQSGLYWIHQEWMDYWDLRKQMKDGFLRNVPECGPGSDYGNPKSDVNLEPNELKRRRQMLHQQSKFRTKVLTSEFWGMILDSRGEMLLPRSTYTVVGDRVVRLPKTAPYPTLKWPGTSFSPMPHLLRHDGRSLLQGLKSLWYAMCSLFALYMDNMNWIVNPPRTTDISYMVDQDDLDDYPGKNTLVRNTQPGTSVIKTEDRRSQTGDILATQKFMDAAFQAGGPLTYTLQGRPDDRGIPETARKAAQDLEQSNNVMSLAAENLDDGALNAIQAAYETIRINITYKELLTWMGQEVADRYRVEGGTGLKLPSLTTGSFGISGATSLLRNQEVISTISQLILPLYTGEMGKVFPIYLEAGNIVRAIVRRSNLEQEGIMVDDKKMKEIAAKQQAMQDAQPGAMQDKEAAEAATAQAGVAHKGAQAEKFAGEGASEQADAALKEEQARQLATGGGGAAPGAEMSPGAGGAPAVAAPPPFEGVAGV